MKAIRISKLAPLLAAATAAFALTPSHLAAQGTVVGGAKNAAPGGISVVVGGAKNRSVGGGSVIVGGNTNRANGDNSAIVTGFQNTTSTTGKFSGIGAGSNNLISGQGSFIGSGNKNTASGLSTIVLGGTDNTCSGQFSVIGGGRRNTLNAKESYLFGNDINHNGTNTGIVYLADNSRGGSPLAQNLPANTMACRFDEGYQFFADPTSNTPAFQIDPTGNVDIIGEGFTSVTARCVNSIAQFIGQHAAGTRETPTATGNNNTLVFFGGSGHTGSGFSPAQAAIRMGTTENWTTTARGTEISFETTPIGSQNRSTVAMTLKGDGRVGIGTTNPTKALVEINGGTGSHTDSQFGFLNSTTPTGNGPGPITVNDMSLYASGTIGADVYFAFSDGRIKQIEGQSDAVNDLATLLGIEVTDYSYIDTISKGSGKQKKVIAQQVEQVYPQAVSLSTDVVPDIYKKAGVSGEWVHLESDLKKGDRVRLIGEKKEGIHEVIEVAQGKFRTSFEADANQVFVYGREVSDFRNVDYEAISMLNVSATQELARKLEAKDAEIAELKSEKDAEFAELKAENTALAAQLTALEARDTARDDRLARLEQSLVEQSLEDAARTVAVPVALKVAK